MSPNRPDENHDDDLAGQSPDSSWRKYNDRFYFFDQLPHRQLEAPLDAEILARNEDIAIPPADLDMLAACARWEIPPPFYKPGRTAEIPFIKVETFGDRRIGSYKIKGAGYVDHGVICPPQDEEEYKFRFAGESDIPEAAKKSLGFVLAYMVFNEDGSIGSEIAEAPPKGGITLEKAKTEYDNAMILFGKSVPAIVPVAYGKYPGLSWHDKEMGFVITAVPDTNLFFRAAEYFGEATPACVERIIIANREALYAALERRFGQITEDSRGVAVMKLMQEINMGFGGSLRKYSEAGLGRYSGHPANYTYSLRTKTAILHDFDTSLEIDTLPEKARGLTIVRDVVSALWGIIQAIMYSMIHTETTPEVFMRMNPFEALLKGYFGENKFIHEAEKVFIRLLFQILSKRPKTMNLLEIINFLEIQKWYKESNDFFAESALGTVMLIFEEDPLNQKYPLPYRGNSRELQVNLEKYKAERKKLIS